MSAEEKLKIFKDKEDKYHFKSKVNSHVDIEYKDKRLKFKLHKWDKEASIEVFLNMVEADTHKFIGNKIEIEDSRKKIRVYPINTRSTKDFYGDATDDIQCHDGGLRYDIKYFEMPQTNFFDTPLVCKNTRWAKQPFLTQEDVEQGISCPFNVEGSYSVYHATKKNNRYMTGKIGHWYRPIVIDALGNKAWCDIEVDRPIDPTTMRITIPQQFLDEAAYPIVVDPDFGETGIGGAQQAIADEFSGIRAGSAWTMPAGGGTANYIRARINSGAADTVDCKVFINEKDSGGAGTHGQIATKENLACAAAEHWEEFTLGDEALPDGVDYILNIIGNDADVGKGNAYYVKVDSVGPTAVASYIELPHSYAAPESPWIDDPAGTALDYSIYCNYSVGWQGKISGITNPAKIMGIPVADIAKVKGIPA